MPEPQYDNAWQQLAYCRGCGEHSGETPIWCRACRVADRSARDNRHLSGASEVEIDRMFGWNEAAYRKVMQLHYAGRHERVARKAITKYM